MADIEKVIKGVFEMLQRNTWKDIDPERYRFQPVLNDALALLKEYRQHLQNDLETLKEEKRRLELEHEAKAFIYKEKDGLMTIKMKI